MKNLLVNISLTVIFAFAFFVGPSSSEAKCIWEGKAPACNGKCRAGFKNIKRSKKGNGKKCITGTKVYCCPVAHIIIRGKAPICNGKCKPGETRVGDSLEGENGNKCKVGKAAQCYNGK